MPNYLKVIDNQSPIKQKYFSLIFLRGDRVEDKVPRLRWVWLCFIEIIFGEELLESLVFTSSNSGCPENKDADRKYGEPNQLNLHIPSGLFTNMFRQQIIQVLYYKYYLQYLFIDPVSEPYEDFESNNIDVTRIRFRLDKGLLYLIIPFRRVYILSALAINLFVDLAVYCVTESIVATIAVGIGTEAIRRILKL